MAGSSPLGHFDGKDVNDFLAKVRNVPKRQDSGSGWDDDDSSFLSSRSLNQPDATQMDYSPKRTLFHDTSARKLSTDPMPSPPSSGRKSTLSNSAQQYMSTPERKGSIPEESRVEEEGDSLDRVSTGTLLAPSLSPSTSSSINSFSTKPANSSHKLKVSEPQNQNHPSTSADTSNEKDGACDNFRVDLAAPFGMCKCGHAKQDHVFTPRKGKRAAPIFPPNDKQPPSKDSHSKTTLPSSTKSPPDHTNITVPPPSTFSEEEVSNATAAARKATNKRSVMRAPPYSPPALLKQTSEQATSVGPPHNEKNNGKQLPPLSKPPLQVNRMTPTKTIPETTCMKTESIDPSIAKSKCETLKPDTKKKDKKKSKKPSEKTVISHHSDQAAQAKKDVQIPLSKPLQQNEGEENIDSKEANIDQTKSSRLKNRVTKQQEARPQQVRAHLGEEGDEDFTEAETIQVRTSVTKLFGALDDDESCGAVQGALPASLNESTIPAIQESKKEPEAHVHGDQQEEGAPSRIRRASWDNTRAVLAEHSRTSASRPRAPSSNDGPKGLNPMMLATQEIRSKHRRHSIDTGDPSPPLLIAQGRGVLSPIEMNEEDKKLGVRNNITINNNDDEEEEDKDWDTFLDTVVVSPTNNQKKCTEGGFARRFSRYATDQAESVLKHTPRDEDERRKDKGIDYSSSVSRDSVRRSAKTHLPQSNSKTLVNKLSKHNENNAIQDDVSIKDIANEIFSDNDGEDISIQRPHHGGGLLSPEERKWCCLPLNGEVPFCSGNILNSSTSGLSSHDLLFFLDQDTSGDNDTQLSSRSSPQCSDVLVLGARPITSMGVCKEVLLYVGSGVFHDGTPAHIVGVLKLSHGGWSLQHIGDSGGDMAAILVSTDLTNPSSAARRLNLALPSSNSIEENGNYCSSMLAWQSNQGMLSHLSRSDLRNMNLFRYEKPDFHDDLHRFELKQPQFQPNMQINAHQILPSRKNVRLLSGGGQPVFQLMKTVNSHHFILQFTYPLSPLVAFATAVASILSTVKGGQVALEGSLAVLNSGRGGGLFDLPFMKSVKEDKSKVAPLPKQLKINPTSPLRSNHKPEIQENYPHDQDEEEDRSDTKSKERYDDEKTPLTPQRKPPKGPSSAQREGLSPMLKSLSMKAVSELGNIAGQISELPEGYPYVKDKAKDKDDEEEDDDEWGGGQSNCSSSQRWSKIRLLVALAAKKQITQLHDLDNGVAGSLLLVGMSMVAELYPSAPSYQLFMAVSILYLHTHFDEKHPQQPTSKDNKTNGDFVNLANYDVEAQEEVQVSPLLSKKKSDSTQSHGVQDEKEDAAPMETFQVLKLDQKLHSPNAILFWGVCFAFLVVVCADLKFIFSSQALVGLAGVRRSETVQGFRMMAVTLTALTLPLKGLLLLHALRKHPRGKRVYKRIFYQLQYYLPLFSIPTRTKALVLETEGRLVSLCWLHLMCALLLFCVAISASTLEPVQAPGFQSGYGGGPNLLTILFIKSITILLVFMALANQLSFKHAMKKFGCLFYPFTRKKYSTSSTTWITTLPLNSFTLRNFIVTKGIDFIISFLLWFSLLDSAGSLNAGGFGVVVMFRLILGVSIICDGIAVVLSLLAGYMLAVYVTQEEDSDSEEEEEASSVDSGSDDDSTSYDDDDDEEEEDEEEEQGRVRSSNKNRDRSEKQVNRVHVEEGVEVPDLEDGYDDYIYTFEGGDYDLGTNQPPSPDKEDAGLKLRAKKQSLSMQPLKLKGTMGFADPAYQYQQQQQPPPPPIPPPNLQQAYTEQYAPPAPPAYAVPPPPGSYQQPFTSGLDISGADLSYGSDGYNDYNKDGEYGGYYGDGYDDYNGQEYDDYNGQEYDHGEEYYGGQDAYDGYDGTVYPTDAKSPTASARDKIRASIFAAHQSARLCSGGDSKPVMSPGVFSRKWQAITDHSGFIRTKSVLLNKARNWTSDQDFPLTTNQVRKHLEDRGFIIVASGNKNNEIKVYAYCVAEEDQVYDVNQDKEDQMCICFVEIISTMSSVNQNDTQEYMALGMKFTFKCINEDKLSKFSDQIDVETISALS